jgi:hypothetical protein
MAISWDGAVWYPATSYPSEARVVYQSVVWRAMIAGMAGVGAGPTIGESSVDGTVLWRRIGIYTGCVLDVAPELLSGPNAILQPAQTTFLRLAEQLVADLSIWGDLLDDGRRYLAAHMGQLVRLRGRGPVTAESVGQISRSYASLTQPEAIQLTSAGRAYMDLVRTLPSIFGFTGP